MAEVADSSLEGVLPATSLRTIRPGMRVNDRVYFYFTFLCDIQGGQAGAGEKAHSQYGLLINTL